MRTTADLLRRAWELLRAGWRRLPGLSRRLRKPAKIVVLVLIAFGGAWLGISVAASTKHQLGPVETTMRLVPSLRGDSVVALPPLGTLAVDSHDGPLRLDLSVDGINQDDARRIFSHPETLNGLEAEITSDLRSAVYELAIKSLIAGTLGAGLAVLLVIRRWRPTLITTGAAAAVILASFGTAGATWNPRSVTEPKFNGLLTSAPSLIGSARDIAENMDAYSDSLVKLVTNVTKLYDVTSTLPAYEPGSDVIRVLHVSDMHLGEQAWDVVASVVDQYSIDLIVDSGDITDHGTAAENQFLQRIPYLGVPYVWVRGNHDSTITQKAMSSLANVVVLDGKVRTVKGIRFLGAGDPRFTPDREHRDEPREIAAVGAQAEAVARVADQQTSPVDVFVVHDGSASAAALDGHAPLILAGHRHVRIRQWLPGGTFLMHEGSTGGSGLRATESTEKAAQIQMSVLYFGRDTKKLEAWDEITLGGLGLRSAKIERRQLNPADEEITTPSPVPTQTGPPLKSPLPTPTISLSPTDGATPPPTSSDVRSPPTRTSPPGD
ncbi:metallophosphoesterase family protein [Flindersiella endophytica]